MLKGSSPRVENGRPATPRKGQHSLRKAGPKGPLLTLSPVTPQASGGRNGGIVPSSNYPKTSEALSRLTPIQYRVTQEDGTEP